MVNKFIILLNMPNVQDCLAFPKYFCLSQNSAHDVTTLPPCTTFVLPIYLNGTLFKPKNLQRTILQY